MTIQCPECQTRFRLPDDKVKPGGTKVRCSRCRHIFTVRPEPEPAPVAAPKPPAPPAPVPEEVDFGSFNMEPVAPAAVAVAAVATAAAVGSEEGDRETAPAPAEEPFFAGQSPSDDAMAASDDEPAGSAFSYGEATEEAAAFSFAPSAAEAQDDVFGETVADPAADAFEMTAADPAADAFEETASASAFSFEQTDPSAIFSFEEEEETDPAAEEFSFDAAADGDPLPDSGAEEFSFDPQPAEFSFSEETEEEFSLEGNAFSFDEVDTAAPSPLATAGEPEGDEFDFSNMSFGEDEPPARQEMSAVAASPLVDLPPVQKEAPPARPAPEPVEREAPLPIPPMRRRRRRSPISGVLVFVILLLLGLSGAAGYFFLQGEIPDTAQLIDRLMGDGTATVPAGQIRLTDLNGYFVDNQEVGQVFVIQGKALNEFSESRSAIAVKGVLFNAAGKPVLQQTVFSGNPLEEEALRSLPFSRIEESMNNQFGDSLSNLNVAPGKAIPFTIVFRKLPGDLAEFTVEAADSRPGSG